MPAKTQDPAQERANNLAKEVFGNLKLLSVEAENWERDFYNPTMDKLYGLLSQALGDVIRLQTEGSKAVRAFTDIMKKKKYTVTGRTSVELRVVRVVFNIAHTTQRANRYAKVLQIAQANKVTPEKFAEWVVEEGGIDEIRRSISKNKKAEPDYERIAEDFYDTAQAMPEITIGDASFTAFDDTDYRLLAVRKNSDGSFTAVSEVANYSLMKSALAFLGKAVSKTNKQADDDEKQAQGITAADDEKQAQGIIAAANQNEAEAVADAQVKEAA